MSDHTPGPWRVIEAPQLETAVIVAAATTNVAILSWMGNAAKPIEQRDADARLIAAAPDLLALALQYASECAECTGDGWSDDTGQKCESCADIRAVIAKVTASS